MSDLISRQAAIAEFSCCELTPDGGIDANYALDFLEQMPSAQPDADMIHLQKEQAYMQGWEDAKASTEPLFRYSEAYVKQIRAERDFLQELVNDMAEPKEWKWIPCSERLPEEDVDVLVSYRYKEGEGDTSHVYIDITTYGQMYFGGNRVGDYKHWRAPLRSHRMDATTRTCKGVTE